MTVKCLRCGKDTNHEQVFCDSCLESMENYPVKPGTHVHLPKQAASTVPKKAPPRKRVLSPEELLVRFKKLTVWLSSIIVVLVIALGLAVTALVMAGQALEEVQQTGKNFTVETTPDA